MPQTDAKKELWRPVDGPWRYAPLEREACAKVRLTEADRRYLDKFPTRIQRFT